MQLAAWASMGSLASGCGASDLKTQELHWQVKRKRACTCVGAYMSHWCLTLGMTCCAGAEHV